MERAFESQGKIEGRKGSLCLKTGEGGGQCGRNPSGKRREMVRFLTYLVAATHRSCYSQNGDRSKNYFSCFDQSSQRSEITVGRGGEGSQSKWLGVCDTL